MSSRQIIEFTHHSSLNQQLFFLMRTDPCASLPLYSLVIVSQTQIKSGGFNRENTHLPTVKVIHPFHLDPEPSGTNTDCIKVQNKVYFLAPGVLRCGRWGSFSGSGFYSHFSLHIFRCDSVHRDLVAFVRTILGCPRSSSLHL